MADEGSALHRFATGDLAWSSGVIVFIDVMESVRLTARDGGLFITRWIEQRQAIEALFAKGGGRVIRSTGDGIIGQFSEPRAAMGSLFEAMAIVERANADLAGALPIAIRVGMARGEFLSDRQDVYGEAVNLAARLAGLGMPSAIIVSEDVRGEMVDGVDADIEDLGACYLKHLEAPIRAYALRPVGIRRPPAMPARKDAQLVPTIAVVPLMPIQGGPARDVLGDIIADELISALSGSPYLNVISRLSAAVARQRALSPGLAAEALQADYIVSGSYSAIQDRVRATLELTERKTGLVRLEQRFSMPAEALITSEFHGFDGFIAGLLRAVLRNEVQRVRRQTLPNLESHSLLVGAVSMMHRAARQDFTYAADILAALAERHPREALPQAWLACWYTIKVQKGFSDDPAAEGREAQALARRAMDLDPDNPLALAVAGLIETNFARNFDEAAIFLERASELNPNETYALLHNAALLQFTDRGEEAYPIARRAMALSPFDPHRYYFEAIAASSAFSAGLYDVALAHADEAIRANRLYPSGSRVRTAALWHLGRPAEARASAETLRMIEPNLTVERWLAKSPAADFDVGRRLAGGLRGAGIPEH
ncbi:MAG: adenylate/guanylate cyclase domain-containing protein [Rhabdaerophilum sp.]